MPISKFPVQQALDFIDGTLIKQLPFSRIDEATRSKTHFFKAEIGGKQFAVVVGDVDAESGKYRLKQTRILLEEPPDKLLDVQNLPIDKPWKGSSAKRSFSQLSPPKQHSVLVGSEAGLRSLLEWYTGKNGVTDTASPNVRSAHPSSIQSVETTASTTELDDDGPNHQLDPEKQLSDSKADIEGLRIAVEGESNQIVSEYANKPGTDVEAIVKRRIGQGPFRSLLENIYGVSCCLSGLANRRLLIASHIVPWSKSSDNQKTDPENGLLLSVIWDALFDKGFVSFDDNGKLLCSDILDEDTARLLGISLDVSLPTELLTDKRRKNLFWHREYHEFKI